MVEKQWLLTQTHLGVSRKEQQVLLFKDMTSTLFISLEHMPDSMRHLLLFPSLSAHCISVPCHMEVFRGNDNGNVPFPSSTAHAAELEGVCASSPKSHA